MSSRNLPISKSGSDPTGELLSEQAVKLGKFGTFDATLALPSQVATGPTR